MHRIQTPALWATSFALAVSGIFAAGPSRAEEKATEKPMAALAIGESVPDFTLADTEGAKHRLADYLGRGRLVVLEWFNPDCPFIKKHHAAHQTLNDLSALLGDRGVLLAVNSGASGKQGHGLERNRAAKKDYGIPYPILLDEEGTVGRLYGAKTTPHMYVISPEGKLLYQGALDDNPSSTELGKTNYVRAAVEQHAAGGAIAVRESKPYGCSVKYAAP